MQQEYPSNIPTRRNQGVSTVACFLALVVCVSVLAFAFQGSRGIWQPDEGYYTGAATTMERTGHILVPWLQDNFLIEKPPVIYWGMIAGLRVFGHNEFGARSFTAFFYVATALAVGMLAFCLFGQKRDGLVAGFVYATMVIPFIAANFITPDTPLALWTMTAMLFFWKSVEPMARHVTMWKLLMCAALGLGFLTKGPAVLLVCGAMFAFLVVRRQTAEYFLGPWAIVGFLIFCVLGLGWYVYVGLKIPGAAVYFFDNEIWGRLISDKYNRNPGITGAFIYLPVLVFGSMPWSIIWWDKREYLKSTLFKKAWWAGLPDRPVALFLLCWFFVPLVVLCLASSKLGLYTLPIFPALAIATSHLWVKKIPLTSSLGPRQKLKAFAKPAVLTGLWVLLLLGTKLALAYYPTPQDARALWAQISKYLPDEDYEIITLDKHAAGLLFYGAKEIENVTKTDDPYPTFPTLEHITTELKEMTVDKHCTLFLVRGGDDTTEVQKILAEENIAFRQVTLPYERSLLICRPSKE
jgi:4-amino-4-deoxy-L-arabinose transferase-like glycosyltransferase